MGTIRPGGSAWVASSHQATPDSTCSVVMPPAYSAPERAGVPRFARACSTASARSVAERVDHPGLGVRAGDAEVHRRRLLQPVQPPASRRQEVVDQEDVEAALVGGGERDVEERVAQHPQFGERRDGRLQIRRRCGRCRAAMAM